MPLLGLLTQLALVVGAGSAEHPAASITRRITNARSIGALGNSIPGGMIAGNGDLGLAMGSAPAGPGLTLAMGKNDFWGVPGEHVTFGATFNHFSPGWLTLTVSPPGGRSSPWNATATGNVNASQRLQDGRLTLDSADLSPGGYGIRSEAVVLSHATPRNTVLVSFSATCPTGQDTATITANLSTDNAWVLPVAAEVAAASDTGDPVLQLRKKNQPTPWHPTLLTPCDEDLILEDGLRTFTVDSSSNQLGVAGNATTAGQVLPRLCLAIRPQDQRVITVPCGATTPQAPSEWFWRASSGRVTSADGKRCMVVENTNSSRCTPCPWGANGGCPNQPPPRTQCRWQQYEVTARPCVNAAALSNTSLLWGFEPATGAKITGMLQAILPAPPLSVHGEKLPNFTRFCLTAAEPTVSNNLAVVVRFSQQLQQQEQVAVEAAGDRSKIDQSTMQLLPPPDWGGDPAAAGFVSVNLTLSCGQVHSVAVGVATERDALDSGGDELALAHKYSIVAPADQPSLMAEHQQGWAQYWNRSAIEFTTEAPELAIVFEWCAA